MTARSRTKGSGTSAKTRVSQNAASTRNAPSGKATAASRARLAQKDKAPARSPAVPPRTTPKGRQRTNRDVDTAHSNRRPGS